jgi:hypothetical protein
MTRQIDRRHALRLFGGASAAVALAACGNADGINDNIFSAETIMTVSKDGDSYLGLITIGVKR